MAFVPFALVIAVSLASFAGSVSGIVGGDVAPSHVPYQVALYANGTFTCSGAIITDNCIITTAQCAQSSSLAGLRIRGGIRTLRDTDGVTRGVTQKFIPDNFNLANLNNDIAILKLANPLTGANIRPISLNTQGIEFGQPLRVTGWGWIRPTDKSYSVPIKEIYAPIQTTAECQRQFGDRITDSKFCAGGTSPGTGPCFGDAGDPAVRGNRLYGISSWSTGCALPNTPVVYTNIRRFVPWITDIVSTNC